MKLVSKILLSFLYPLLLFVLLAGFTGRGAAAAALTLAFLVVMLPIFFYSVWNKAPTKVKVAQWAAGTTTAFILRLVVSSVTNLWFIKTFDFLHVAMVRGIAAIGIILVTFWLARLIEAKVARVT